MFINHRPRERGLSFLARSKALWPLGATAAAPAAEPAPRPDQLAYRDLVRELVETDTSVATGSCTGRRRASTAPPPIPDQGALAVV